jgi:nucleoid-associated protein YgaU
VFEAVDVSARTCRRRAVDIPLRSIERVFEPRGGAAVGGRGAQQVSRRDLEVERAMRAHPAGKALAARAGQGARPCAVAPVPLRRVGPPRRVRLTARGRRLVTVLALAAATGGVALAGGFSSSGSGLHLEGQDSVVVRSGDTLWSIASSVAGDGDVRAVVHRIQVRNGLHGTAIVPGEVLRLP